MTARTHTGARPLPAGADTRPPWWALPLSVVVFAALFLLIAGQGEMGAAGGDPGVGGVLAGIQEIQQTLSR